MGLISALFYLRTSAKGTPIGILQAKIMVFRLKKKIPQQIFFENQTKPLSFYRLPSGGTI
jgi:hypothetical protein